MFLYLLVWYQTVPFQPLFLHLCAARAPCRSSPELCWSWSCWSRAGEPCSGGNATEDLSTPSAASGSPLSAPLSAAGRVDAQDMWKSVQAQAETVKSKPLNNTLYVTSVQREDGRSPWLVWWWHFVPVTVIAFREVNSPPFSEHSPCHLGWGWRKCDSCGWPGQSDSYWARSTAPERTRHESTDEMSEVKCHLNVSRGSNTKVMNEIVEWAATVNNHNPLCVHACVYPWNNTQKFLIMHKHTTSNVIRTLSDLQTQSGGHLKCRASWLNVGWPGQRDWPGRGHDTQPGHWCYRWVLHLYWSVCRRPDRPTPPTL